MFENKIPKIDDVPKDPTNTGSTMTTGSHSATGSKTSGTTPKVSQNFSQSISLDDDDELPIVNMNEKARQGDYSPVYFREKVTDDLMRSLLTREHPNALLLGRAGVGKTAVVENIVRLLVEGDPVVETLFKGTTFYELRISDIISNRSMVGEIEGVVREIIAFAEDPENKVILYVDEIHQLFNGQSTMNGIAQQLKQSLGRGKLHMIASTTETESRSLKEDSAFMRRFAVVNVPELTLEQTATIIDLLEPVFEKHYGFGYHANLGGELVNLIHQDHVELAEPAHALGIIDRCLAEFKLDSARAHTDPKHFKHSLHMFKRALKKQQIVAQFDDQARDRVTTLFTQNFVGQANAKAQLTQIVKSLQLELVPQRKPHSLFFAGPTGVGKTEIAKLLARGLFNRNDAFIYLNLSEYSSPMSLTKIIGSARGFVGSESVTEKPFDSLAQNPYQIVVLDELEKACQEVRLLFMQALDEGYILDNKGSKINFSKTIIIGTTNACALDSPAIGFNTPKNSRYALDKLSTVFPIELLNRFDHIISFDALTKAEYETVVKIQYNQFVTQISKYNPDRLTVLPDDGNLVSLDETQHYPFIDTIVTQSYDPKTNGRPAKRHVIDYIESLF